jgi:hypothetical protein
VGHTYGPESLLAFQGEAVERALWTAGARGSGGAPARDGLARQGKGLEGLERAYLSQADEFEQRAEMIRNVVERETTSIPDADEAS